MGSKLNNSPLMSDQEDGNNTESGPDSPSSSLLNDIKMTPKRSKRGMQKRVVSVPIKEVEGSRLKGENSTTTPPSDSWAWRKYGQKPIKGSPFPRGYYRCSSSKGCPARKQVERSKVDPTMLMVTYSSEHNHPCPLPSRNRYNHHQPPPTEKTEITVSTHSDNLEPEPESECEEKPSNLGLEESSLLTTSEEFGWFGDFGATTSTIFESPMFSDIGRRDAESDVSVFFTTREEDESLFADLGELPECSAVFRHYRGVGPQVQIC